MRLSVYRVYVAETVRIISQHLKQRRVGSLFFVTIDSRCSVWTAEFAGHVKVWWAGVNRDSLINNRFVESLMYTPGIILGTGHHGRQVKEERHQANKEWSLYLSSVHSMPALDLALCSYYAVQSTSKSCAMGKIVIPIFRGRAVAQSLAHSY